MDGVDRGRKPRQYGAEGLTVGEKGAMKFLLLAALVLITSLPAWGRPYGSFNVVTFHSGYDDDSRTFTIPGVHLCWAEKFAPLPGNVGKFRVLQNDNHPWDEKLDMFGRRIRERRITVKQVLQDLRLRERRKSMSPVGVNPHEVTRPDLRNILLVGIHLSKVDKDFNWEEARFLNMINDILQLTSEEKRELLHEGFNVMEGLDTLVTRKARNLLVKFLCAIAHSDQVIQGSEVEFINRVNARFGNLVAFKPPGAWHEYEEEVAEILQEEFA